MITKQNNEKTLDQKNGSVNDLCSHNSRNCCLHSTGGDSEILADTRINPGIQPVTYGIPDGRRFTCGESERESEGDAQTKSGLIAGSGQ